MKLIEIYKCLAEETRLRLLHLLAQGPLCVCHFQTVLQAPQVAISKHLAYLRERGLVVAQRHERWMIYRLPAPVPVELDWQLRCLCECAQDDPEFRADLKRLKQVRGECEWLEQVVPRSGAVRAKAKKGARR